MNYVEEAWNAVKPEGDPEYSACRPEHKNELDFRAERVIATGVVSEVSGTPSTMELFEAEVKKLYDAEHAKPREAAATAKPDAEKPKDEDADKAEEGKESLSGKSRADLNQLAYHENAVASLEEAQELANIGAVIEVIEAKRAE